MVAICLAGFGKMNKEVYAAIQNDKTLQVVSILEPKEEKINGALVSSEPAKAFAPAEIIIDFSTKEACVENMVKAAAMGKNVVIGTTGMTPTNIEAIGNALKQNNTSGVISANFSIGVNVFIETAKILQQKLTGYDLEFIEAHHKAKKDSPSGTALRTLAALGKTQAEVPVHALRIGDVVGDHSIVFAGNSERIELIHRATSRKCFAQGAVLSAKWVANKKDGLLHDFKEVIE